MNRREFFARLNPFREELREELVQSKRTAAETNQLFLLAMERGIDPATVDPALLPELLGLQTPKTEVTSVVKI